MIFHPKSKKGIREKRQIESVNEKGKDKESQNSKENQVFVERMKINVEESSKIWEDLQATRNKNKIKNKK